MFQELFARLLVLLHDPLAREQLATQILTVRTSFCQINDYVTHVKEMNDYYYYFFNIMIDTEFCMTI